MTNQICRRFFLELKWVENKIFQINRPLLFWVFTFQPQKWKFTILNYLISCLSYISSVYLSKLSTLSRVAFRNRRSAWFWPTQGVLDLPGWWAWPPDFRRPRSGDSRWRLPRTWRCSSAAGRPSLGFRRPNGRRSLSPPRNQYKIKIRQFAAETIFIKKTNFPRLYSIRLTLSFGDP